MKILEWIKEKFQKHEPTYETKCVESTKDYVLIENYKDGDLQSRTKLMLLANIPDD